MRYRGSGMSVSLCSTLQSRAPHRSVRLDQQAVAFGDGSRIQFGRRVVAEQAVALALHVSVLHVPHRAQAEAAHRVHRIRHVHENRTRIL